MKDSTQGMKRKLLLLPTPEKASALRSPVITVLTELPGSSLKGFLSACYQRKKRLWILFALRPAPRIGENHITGHSDSRQLHSYLESEAQAVVFYLPFLLIRLGLPFLSLKQLTI